MILLLKLIVQMFVQTECSYFFSNCLSIIVFKLTILFNMIDHVFVQIDLFLFKNYCSYVCPNWLLISMFKFNDYISIQVNCWYFCSNWLLTFLFKIECWYFCSIGLLLFLFKTDCWFFCSNWLLKFGLLFNSDIFVPIDCWYFCSNWLLMFLFKLIVDFFVQKWLLIFLFKLIVDISVHVGCLLFLVNCW